MSAISHKLNELGYKPFGDASEHDTETWAKLPELVGRDIPSDYLQFLKDFPGTGIFGTDIVCKGQESAPCATDKLYSISLLYASSSRPAHDVLKLHLMSSEIPNHLLVIGDNDGGDYFCLDLERASFGRVYYFFQEERGLYLLARNFSEFILSLQRREPE